jgi:hypothetical protein
VSSLTPLGNCYTTASGWTATDVTTANVSGRFSLDGFRAVATGTSALYRIDNLLGSSIRLFYTDLDGTFRWRLNGGAWTAVAGTNTGNPAKTVIAAGSAGPHILEMDLTGNAGTVERLGVYATGLAGVEVSKVGNGSYHMLHAPLMTGAVNGIHGAFALADMVPDGQIFIGGTNDALATVAGPSTAYFEGVAAHHERLTAANPHAGTLFIVPPHNGTAVFLPMDHYRDVARSYAGGRQSIGVLSMCDIWPAYAALSGIAGIWLDTAHLGSLGLSMLSDEIKLFTGVRR